MNLNKNNLLFLLLFFEVSNFYAQIKNRDSVNTQDLDEIVISATRTKRELSSLPLPTTIVSKKEINKGNYARLGTILNEQSGITTVSDFGGAEGIQMQGLDAQYTLILVDGVPLIGRTSGTLDINRITAGNIEQIEIVKGASSSLYGSDALAGVINIITSKPKKGKNASIDYRLSTFNTNDIKIDYAQKIGKTSLQMFLNSYNSNGYDLDNNTLGNTVEPFNNQLFNSKIAHQFGEKIKVTLSTKYYKQEQENNSSSTLDGESNVKEWGIHSIVDYHPTKKISSLLEFYSSRYKTLETFKDKQTHLIDSESDYNHLLHKLESRTFLKLNDKDNFVAGLGVNYETLDRTYFDNKPLFVSPYIYGQYDFYPHKKINVILGARYDSHNEYKSQFSPKIAVNYKLNNKISIKSSLGYGYKAPDFRQLYFDFTNGTVGYTVVGYNVANEVLNRLFVNGEIQEEFTISNDQELKPESSINLNIGTRIKFNNQLSFDINMFKNNIHNLIETYALDVNKNNGQNVFTYKNVSNVYTQGLEVNLSWNINTSLKLTSGYQLLYAKSEEAKKEIEGGSIFVSPKEVTTSDFKLNVKDYVGLFNRSKHMANLKLFYAIPKWKMNANLRIIYRSKYGLVSNNGNEYYDVYDDVVKGYAITNIAFNKTFFKNYTLGVGAENLMNYTDTSNITSLPGRILYAKINIKI